MSTAKPRRAASAASRSGVPARFLPNRKSKPIAAPLMPSRCSRMSLMKSAGAGRPAPRRISAHRPARRPAGTPVSRVGRSGGTAAPAGEEAARMRPKVSRGRPPSACARARASDHGPVAHGGPVEIADGNDRASGAPERHGATTAKERGSRLPVIAQLTGYSTGFARGQIGNPEAIVSGVGVCPARISQTLATRRRRQMERDDGY